MKKLVLLFAATFIYSGSSYAQNSPQELNSDAKKIEAQAIQAVEHDANITKIASEAIQKGCTEFSPSATLVSEVSYGFSGETQILVIKRFFCPIKLGNSKISTISSLVRLGNDDVAGSGTKVKVTVGIVDLNGLTLQNQSHAP